MDDQNTRKRTHSAHDGKREAPGVGAERGRTLQTLIIAAGRGRRFGASTQSRPKPLVEVGGVPLIGRILACARRAGLKDFTVVTGYQGGVLEEFLRGFSTTERLTIRFLRNGQWTGGNGISVLRGKTHVEEPFVLLMGDHFFDPRILRKLLSSPLAPGCCRLAVDLHPYRVFDLADATKVALQGERITEIGKTIPNYQAVDTGIFLCSLIIFDALEEAISQGQERLSDAIRFLARRGRMEAVDIGDLFWMDIDDEASRLIANKHLASNHFPANAGGRASDSRKATQRNSMALSLPRIRLI